MKSAVKFIAIEIIFLVTTYDLGHSLGSGGIANELSSTDAIGRLIVVNGSKHDPAVVYDNPASIGDLGKFTGSAGLMYETLSAERKASNGTTDKMETTKAIVPNFAVAQSFGEGKWGVGLAVISPYGLETEWSDTSSVRYVATKSVLNMYNITPAVSFRPSSKFAVGFGVDYFNTFDASLSKMVPVDAVNAGLCLANPLLCPGTSGAPDANSELSGEGDQWGYHTGILYNPSESHSFGVTYHSEVKTTIEGDVELKGLTGASTLVFGGTDFKTKAHIDLFYPQNVQLGYKYSQGDKWDLGFNLAWYDWSSNTQFEIVMPDATATQVALLGAPIPLKWRDVWSATVGGSYRFSDKWKLNAGAYYLPNVYPEETFTPAIPDMEKIGLSVGPSYTKGAWSIDGVYNPLFYKTTTINNTRGQDSTGLASADISGEYKAIVHILGVNVRLRY
ncbi:MAG: Long-chain fatty acid transport protein [Elusimicrobia bacterium]|nr:Long-chain fatty acid transport protein [Elusimicrobiota bacterium]